jgi:ribonuclease PH
MRPSKRKRNELRKVTIETGINNYAEGSCLIKCGNTHIICNATVEEKSPPFLKGKGLGWVTAEYNMLPRATHQRVQRDTVGGRPNSRKLEIQRLIGRSLRAVVDQKTLGERQIIVDCDVIQADGGTRCASVTGGFVAMYLAVQNLIKQQKIRTNPITSFVSAVSCGIYKDNTVLDLDYDEDSTCHADVNFIIDESGKIIEIQGTAEGDPYAFDKIQEMYELAKEGADKLNEAQKKALGKLPKD